MNSLEVGAAFVLLSLANACSGADVTDRANGLLLLSLGTNVSG